MYNTDDTTLSVQLAHLVVEEDTNYRGHHAQDVCESNRVAQHEQRDADDHDPFGGVGHSVAERTDEVKHTERDDVLRKVTEATEEQQDECARPSGEIQL